MEALANEFEALGAPVVFLEQNVYQPLGLRIDRFEAARGQRTCGVPWVVVDSGFRFSCGYVLFESEYRRMVSDAMAQPPLADIDGWYDRSGDDLHATVRLKNRTGRTLSYASWTTVHVLVYERARGLYTTRVVRAVTQEELGGELRDGETARLALSLRDVAVQDWQKAHVIALADYRPEPTQGRFASLQAVEIRRVLPVTPVPTFPPDSPRLYLPWARDS